MLQITRSGFSIWNPDINFWKSPAVSCSLPLTEMETVSSFTSSICRLKRICFMLRMISVTSSTTPSITENSCSTLSMRTEVMANPSREASSTLLSAFPTVRPYPGSKGRNSNFPSKSVESIMITLSGFWKLNNAIIGSVLFYLEYNSTISCSLMFSGIWMRSGIDTKVPSFLSEFQLIHS